MRWRNSKYRLKSISGFTLVELLIVIAVIGILSGLATVVLSGAITDAKIARTKSQIKRIDLILLKKWESFESKPLQINFPHGTSLDIIQSSRLWAMRDLMRMELPDRVTDVTTPPVAITVSDSLPSTFAFTLPAPSLHRRYNRRAAAATTWSPEHEGAECLYLILDGIDDEHGSVLEHFNSTEIGDTDGDGMKEILDAWGNPIEFIRWPAGFPSAIQDIEDPLADPMDPFERDDRWGSFEPHVILPLVYSAGPNKEYGLISETDRTQKTGLTSSSTVTPTYMFIDPYLESSGDMLGSPSTDGGEIDNLENHSRVVN